MLRVRQSHDRAHGLILLVVLLSLAQACGSSSDDKDGPIEKCQEFASSWCGRAVECLAPQHGTAEQIGAACKSNVAAAIDCNRAVGVEPTYAECRERLKTETCDTLFPTPEGSLPQPCVGVILLQ